MPTWTGLVIGWITVCATATFPAPQWGDPALVLYPTRAACEQSNVASNAWLAAMWKQAGRTDPVHLQCWCDHVTPAK